MKCNVRAHSEAYVRAHSEAEELHHKLNTISDSWEDALATLTTGEPQRGESVLWWQPQQPAERLVAPAQPLRVIPDISNIEQYLDSIQQITGNNVSV